MDFSVGGSGMHFYASKSFFDPVQGRRIFWGWAIVPPASTQVSYVRVLTRASYGCKPNPGPAHCRLARASRAHVHADASARNKLSCIAAAPHLQPAARARIPAPGASPVRGRCVIFATARRYGAAHHVAGAVPASVYSIECVASVGDHAMARRLAGGCGESGGSSRARVRAT